MIPRVFGKAFFIALVLFLLMQSIIYAGQKSDNTGNDPWNALQEYYRETQSATKDKKGPEKDPWEKLRQIYLPFTVEEEGAALTNKKAGKKVSGFMAKALEPYRKLIDQCAKRFSIPEEIIGAVIMVESSANPRARAKTSTASGLMQTIQSTFKEARTGLRNMGIIIKNNPFNPRSSIYAGSWYLDRMFHQVAENPSNGHLSREDIYAWKHPVQYYYVGPGKGEQKGDIVFFYQNGERSRVNKKSYSDKVLHWARILKTTWV